MDDFTKPNTHPLPVDFFRRHYLPLIIVAALLLVLGAYEFGRSSVYRAYPQLAGIEQANAMLAKVAELIQLPAGETPTMATINDAASVVKTQPFLSSAENGDVLIVYANAQEAILYRPSTNKLIAVGPVNSATPQPLSSSQFQPKLASTTVSSTQDATNTSKK